MKTPLIPLALLALLGCAAQRSTNTDAKIGDTRTTPVEFLDEQTYLLTQPADDPSYGYSKSNPVKVGGSNDGNGPLNERRFLNGLLGPNGQEIKYFRAGSCCPFKTPHGLIDNTGMLDRYRVSWTGASDTLDIYINMYDAGDLMIPVGLTAKRK